MRYLITGVMIAGLASAGTYEVAPSPTDKLQLHVEKTGLYRGKVHVFLFEKYQGVLQYDPAKPEASSIQLTIESNSIVCKDTWVSANDLKKITDTALNDMLAAKKHPWMTFHSTSLKPLGRNQFEAQGMLTIRDVAKPVTVAVTLDAAVPARLRLKGSAKVHLKDYGLKPPSALLGAIGTKEEMSLEFEITAAQAD